MFNYYLRQREDRAKFLNIREYSREKLVLYLVKIFVKKKVQFVIVDFQTQFTDNKRKLRRENQWKPITLKKVVSFTRNHSIHWKLFRIVETIHFNGSHFIYWKLCFLVEFITFKGSCCP